MTKCKVDFTIVSVIIELVFLRKRGKMFQPLGDRVLIKPLPADEVTKSGIVIPNTAKESPAEGEVVVLGNGKMKNGKSYEFSVKKGDKVLFSKYAGDELKIDDQEYKVMREEDILGIL